MSGYEESWPLQWPGKCRWRPQHEMGLCPCLVGGNERVWYLVASVGRNVERCLIAWYCAGRQIDTSAWETVWDYFVKLTSTYPMTSCVIPRCIADRNWWISKLWYMQTVKYPSAVKGMLHTTTQENVWFHFYLMSRKGKSVDVETTFMVA